MKFTLDMKKTDVPKEFRGALGKWKKYHTTPLGDLFWSKVDRSGDGCWPFKTAVKRGTYGAFILRGETDKRMRAHRVAWIITNGHVPDGLFVLHKCDYPPCCNPAHLFLGTKKDNAVDMTNKGRNYLCEGEKSSTHILTDQDVLEIRRRYDPSKTTYALMAKEFGVSEMCIRAAATGVTWKHIPKTKKPDGVYRKGEKHGHAKLTEFEVIAIRRRILDGESISEVANEFRVTTACISLIVKRKNWKHV